MENSWYWYAAYVVVNVIESVDIWGATEETFEKNKRENYTDMRNEEIQCVQKEQHCI